MINVDGQPFVATIKLDDHYNEEYAKFKDIGIKQMASAVRGSNGRNNSANPPAQMPRYTIHELVDFVKQNFKENSRFTENILSDFSERLDQAYFSAVNRGDMKTAQKMVENAAKRAGLKIIPKEKLSTISFYADVLHIPLKIAMQMADWDYISKSPYSFSRTS